jgi:SAM-dependent methyltransferase
MSPDERAVPPRDAVALARLERGARLAAALAPELCRIRSGNDDCGALHGIWPLLRRLGLAAEPSRHDTFYRSALGALAASGEASRVLVAGSADWGMLELIVDVYHEQAAQLEVTVVDRCPTPALLNAWYGTELGLAVRTGAADLIRYVDDAPFDVICTHSLLGYPAAAARGELVDNWRRLLRPGGSVVTVTRLSVDTHPAPDPEQARWRASVFGDEVLARWRSLGWSGDEGEMRRRAERFSLAQVSHPVGTAADLRALFESRGFVVVRLDERSIGAASASAQAVAGAARSGVYGEIVAVRHE